MSKITTIIDIGSNSMRMVVYKKSSRFAFHLINESKSKVKISENSYKNNGNLQVKPMIRAFEALKSFLEISKNLKSRKILCVATSALRDAPNKKEFLSKVSKELKLNIKIIDGKKEAYYGGVASLNLIACDDFTTVDIGGGSTELAFVKENNIVDTVSLDIGTIRLKEIFFDDENYNDAKKYIIEKLDNIDYKIDTIVGLGGSIRAISSIIMKSQKYPLDILHGFEYDFVQNIDIFNQIFDANTDKLKKLGIGKDRYDTIKIGVFIFKTILEYFSVKKVITSSAGVREGVYLTDILRNSNHKFPNNFNVSIKSLIDRFSDDSTQNAYLGNNCKKIFTTLSCIHGLDEKYKTILTIASKLRPIGLSLNFDKNEDSTFWYILKGLNYNFTHEDKVLIAIIIKYSNNTIPDKDEIKEFNKLLPKLEIVKWLCFMMNLNIALNKEFSKTTYDYAFDGDILSIYSTQERYMVKNEINKLKIPIKLEIRYNQK